MNVKEIREIAPKAEVYELQPNIRYLIVADPTAVPMNDLSILLLNFHRAGIQNVCCMRSTEGGLKFYEFGEADEAC